MKKNFLGIFPGIYLLPIYIYMTNYKQFYNSWMGFAKPKRRLLLERTVVPAAIKPDDFLALTTDAAELERITSFPSIKEPFNIEKAGTLSIAVELDPTGRAKVVDHEGRNRAFAAKQAGNERVPLNIIVVNKEGAKFSEINEFVGQFTPVVIKRIKLFTRDVTLDMSDPLGIGESRDIKGYCIMDKWGMTPSDGIYRFIMGKFHNQNGLTDLGYVKFVELLNRVYIFKDSSGKEYRLERTQINPWKNEPTRGLYYLNLMPHPIEVHGSLEEANKVSYIIKKK